MTDIDSNSDANERARMDQDNQKNVKTPKPGGNREGADTQGIVPNSDIDERNRAEAERNRGDHQEGDAGINVGGAEVLERDKRNP